KKDKNNNNNNNILEIILNLCSNIQFLFYNKNNIQLINDLQEAFNALHYWLFHKQKDQTKKSYFTNPINHEISHILESTKKILNNNLYYKNYTFLQNLFIKDQDNYSYHKEKKECSISISWYSIYSFFYSIYYYDFSKEDLEKELKIPIE